MPQRILAGDVGGTKIRLGLFDHRRGGPELIRENRYVTADFHSLPEVCADFLGDEPAPGVACFGVPGPIISGRAHATNIPWELSEARLKRELGIGAVRLINDLGATAYGVLHLEDSELAVLQDGSAEGAQGRNVAVIAAGTGLGEAALVMGRGRYHAVASEGGHSSFAPCGSDQMELLKFLAGEFGHVSFERVLSGPGLYNIYRFLRHRGGPPEPGWLSDRLEKEDPAAVISAVALDRSDTRCVEALDLFVEIYGAEAANLALKVLALGGVYLGGGIAPKILPVLRGGGFVRGFLGKGRMNPMLRRIAVRVSLNPGAALIGAAHRASEMVED